MLIVVHNRNGKLLLQTGLNGKALGSLDIFQVNPPEGWLQRLNHTHKLINITHIKLYIKHVNIREYLEEQPLPLHYRLACFRAYVAETEYCRDRKSKRLNSSPVAL